MNAQRVLRIAAAALLVTITVPVTSSTQEIKRIYVTVDKSQAMSFQTSPISQISVTNPMIADVYVTSPTQVLLSGKTPGRTSLIVVQGGQVGYFDIVVHPAPAIMPKAPLVPAEEHGVEVLRAGKPSHQLFVRDTDQLWVPLGTPKVEPEAPQK